MRAGLSDKAPHTEDHGMTDSLIDILTKAVDRPYISGRDPGNDTAVVRITKADLDNIISALKSACHSCNWQALKCRFGCDAPVGGIYFAPEGCWCFPDHMQALCEQHAVKGLQNNEMVTVITRPADREM